MLNFGNETNREIGKVFLNLFAMDTIAIFVTSYITKGEFLPMSSLFFFATLGVLFFCVGIYFLSKVDKATEDERRKREILNRQTRNRLKQKK